MLAESGYYYTQLLSIIAFIEALDANKLSIDPAEFNSKLTQTLGTHNDSDCQLLKPNSSLDAFEKMYKNEQTARFMECTLASELSPEEVGILLKDYKRLVKENRKLIKDIQDVKIHAWRFMNNSKFNRSPES